MLNVPNSIKALYQTDGVRKNFRVHFPNGEMADITNDNVVQESVKFTESLCSQSTFKFGLAEASVLEFETVGVGNMFGMTIEAAMEIDTSSLSAADISAIQADEGDGSLVVGNTFSESSADWKNGYLIDEDGTEVARTIYKYSQGFFSISPNTSYHVGVTSEAAVTGAFFIAFYTSDYTFISRIKMFDINVVGTVDGIVTTPTNASFYRIGVRSSSISDIYVGFFYYAIPLGTFIVDRCPRNHGAMAHRQITAYSIEVNPKIAFPSVMPFPSVYAKRTAVEAVAMGTGLVEAANVSPPVANSVAQQYLYNSSGRECRIYLQDLDGNVSAVYRQYGYIFTGMTGVPAFVSLDMPDYDAEAYEQFGISVANAITNAGHDLTYNSARQKIYANNEEALRRCVPWLFAPCIEYSFSNSNGGNPSFSIMSQPIDSGELVPVLCSEFYSTQYDVGFRVLNNNYRLDGAQACGIMFVGKMTAGNRIRIRVSIDSVTTADISATGYLRTLPTVHAYKLSDYATQEILFSNNGESTAQYVDTYNSKSEEIPSFMYSSVDLKDLFQSDLELNAQFAKTDRQGGFEVVRLDNSSLVSILPENYSECWWDEYDVDPIGTVTVTYGDEENTENYADISVGSGSSVYNMSDNVELKSLVNTDYATVASLINAKFAPYAGAVAFTPTDLTMQGWPWLEAGDALEIEAEDGSIVKTYALRVEMSGIQHLQMVVTAQGGEIIEGVS